MSTRCNPTERVPGLLIKRLVLAFGGTYLAMVSVTNLVNFVNAVAGTNAKFLYSENTG